MHPLAERVRRTIRRTSWRLPEAASSWRSRAAPTRWLSSTCCANWRAAVRDSSLAGLAHLNHQLRGPAADEDEEFCRELASRLGLPIRGRARGRRPPRGHQPRIARRSRPHAPATRSSRERPRDLEADRIAVGHTRDDQAETYLLRLLRGAGPQGLAGIHPRFGSVIRPLIDVDARRAQALPGPSVASAFREDETNADTVHCAQPYPSRVAAAARGPVLAGDRRRAQQARPPSR